jgi:hypothetical protein
VLLPGPDAVLAPEWVPWSERLRPGDLGTGDLLPTEPDDLRLEPGWSGEDAPPPNSAVAEEEATAPRAAEIGAVADELGMGRARVLSRLGLHRAAERWEENFGPRTPMAQAAPASCQSCGFLVPLAGSLRQSFGVCANEYAPADGRVVSFAYGCGGHSEAVVMPVPPQPPLPVIDETKVDALHLRDPAADPAAPEPADGSSADDSAPGAAPPAEGADPAA